MVGIGDDEFAEYMENMEKRRHMRDQAAEVGSNDGISGIEEVFAHFISFQYVERRKVSSNYARDGYIRWGLDILYEKASAENPVNPVDWSREEMKNVFEDIARRGQARKNNETRDVFVIFLKRLMPRTDRKRINYMKQIAENDLSTAYKDLHQALNDIEHKERTRGEKRILREFKSFEQEVDWDNPREIEDIVLHKVLERGVGDLSLSETENLLKKEIGNEAKNLKDLVGKARSLERELDEGELDEELLNAVKELLHAENEVEQLT